ncbi:MULTISPECIES: nucleoside hydrolase [unclassified Meiothermus]|uniref:nucleoside hydrolase n=1 Tax=unclassified Meiothermus TaxID=370471 RepID=UPI000D7BA315|nr:MULTISPECIES: nucleoside hydrolase [unclassified Meiothermus]PZA08155.1 ribonucleoside hydrolase [Meiothermus sp. Pnk-1]RYM32294.1 nucleoside hydrolase [Meiothermus sp. PNK-Is4]
MPRKIIYDCDPGHDDAIAMMLALASPELEVLGVTVVHGNVSLARTARNALVVREILGAEVPVYAGADRPLVRERISAEAVHGVSGLDGPHLPEPKRGLEQKHAVAFLIETVKAHPGEVTLVPTGPLTNLALALRLEPQIAGLIPQIVLMGGSLDTGNWTPAAEFNILCDPHAARIVFESGIPIVMMGLNLTHQVIATPRWVERFRALGTPVGEFTAQLLEFFREHHVDRYGWEGAALHDPCAVAYLIRPELFKTQAMYVAIETNEGLNFGRTVCDRWGVTGRPANAQVGLAVDAEGLFDLLVERVGKYR